MIETKSLKPADMPQINKAVRLVTEVFWKNKFSKEHAAAAMLILLDMMRDQGLDVELIKNESEVLKK